MFGGLCGKMKSGVQAVDRMLEANREYRDRLFKAIFGNPQSRAWTLNLYKAVDGTPTRMMKAYGLQQLKMRSA